MVRVSKNRRFMQYGKKLRMALLANRKKRLQRIAAKAEE